MAVNVAPSLLWGAAGRFSVGNVDYVVASATQRGYAALARFGKVVLAFMEVQESESDGY